MHPFIDYAHDYNAMRRRHRLKRHIAHVCVLLAFLLVCISFGMLISAVCNPYFSAVAVNIMIAGFWGLHWLTTRHRI